MGFERECIEELKQANANYNALLTEYTTVCNQLRTSCDREIEYLKILTPYFKRMDESKTQKEFAFWAELMSKHLRTFIKASI